MTMSTTKKVNSWALFISNQRYIEYAEVLCFHYITRVTNYVAIKMAKANVILLNSILWNLREVTKLTERVKKHCGDVECTSWRYPLTTCGDIKVFKLLENNKNLDSYTYILELTYDRLLYLFNLIIKYLESIESMEKFRPGKNVFRPRTLSLAAVLQMMWDRIQGLGAALGEKTEMAGSEKETSAEELKGSRSSMSTQSEVCSLSACSSCEMVQEFVTQLVLEMEKVLEKQEFCSALSEERKMMRRDLIEITSWSAMSRWLNAIVKDFTNLFEAVEQISASSRKLRHRLDSGERKLQNKTEEHEQETRKLQEKLKDSEHKMSEMKHKLGQLTQEKNALKQVIRAKISEIANNNSNHENKLAELRAEYEDRLRVKKEKKLKKEKEREKEMEKRLNEESKKSEKLENQNKVLEETISNLRSEMNLINSKAVEDKNGFLTKLTELQNEMECLKAENSSLYSTVEEKQRIIKDYSAKIMEAFPELNGVPKPKYKASGNPVTDMESQIEANKLRIELMQLENEKLQKTLTRIKSLKG